MAFNNIDAPGGFKNRRDRRAVAVIQRKAGAEGRLAAAQAKRQRKMARQFERDLGRTIVFYAMPTSPDNAVTTQDPDGAYLSPVIKDGQRQVVVIGPLKASIDHYVTAIGVFLKCSMKLVVTEELPVSVPTDKIFTSIIVEPK